LLRKKASWHPVELARDISLNKKRLRCAENSFHAQTARSETAGVNALPGADQGKPDQKNLCASGLLTEFLPDEAK